MNEYPNTALPREGGEGKMYSAGTPNTATRDGRAPQSPIAPYAGCGVRNVQKTEDGGWRTGKHSTFDSQHPRRGSRRAGSAGSTAGRRPAATARRYAPDTMPGQVRPTKYGVRGPKSKVQCPEVYFIFASLSLCGKFSHWHEKI